MTTAPEFREFASIPRLFRGCCVTEKIDGTNAVVHVTDDGAVFAGSRNRWLTPEADNFGFAAWAKEHENELRTLGPGYHYGEWWGAGIQRGYGLKEKRFSLFNVTRWCLHGTEPGIIPQPNPKAPPKMQQALPPCCGLVPVLYRGEFTTAAAEGLIERMREVGSAAVPGFMNPEGIVVFHEAGNVMFKCTLDGDGHKRVRR